MKEKLEILTRTRLTKSDDQKLRELAKSKGTTSYKMIRNIVYDYLQQNSQTAA
jgi:predicted DNA-binding protein